MLSSREKPIDISELQHILNEPLPRLNCMHLNLQSGRNKRNDVECFFTEMNMLFGVIMFTETWFKCEQDVFAMPQYKSYYMNRTGKRGGGVCMMISNSMQCELLSDFSLVTPDYEVVTVKSGSYIISTCYRPPGGDSSNFLAFLDCFLEFISYHRYHLILGGDFNINLLIDSPIKTEFETTLNFHCCQNTITSPTRLTESTETLLDLFITNVDIRCVLAGVITYAISDHLPIFLSVEQTVKATENLHQYTYRQINPATLTSFRQLVTGTNWDDVLRDENPESA